MRGCLGENYCSEDRGHSEEVGKVQNRILYWLILGVLSQFSCGYIRIYFGGSFSRLNLSHPPRSNPGPFKSLIGVPYFIYKNDPFHDLRSEERRVGKEC